jgi:hypothetical protein
MSLPFPIPFLDGAFIHEMQSPLLTHHCPLHHTVHYTTLSIAETNVIWECLTKSLGELNT